MKNGLIIDLGVKRYYLNNQLHRLDGPAVEISNGFKAWYINNQLHREDGPAIEYPDGSQFWFYHGQQIMCQSRKEFEKLIKLKVFW